MTQRRQRTTLHVNERETVEKQRRSVLFLLQVVMFALLGIVVALGIVDDSRQDSSGGMVQHWWIPLSIAVVFGFIVIALDMLSPRRKLSTISSIVFGVAAGVLLAFLIGIVLEYFAQVILPSSMTDADGPNRQYIDTYRRISAVVKVSIGIALAYLGAATVLQTQDDFRLVIPYVEFAKQIRGTRPFLIDTSCLIDGRIYPVSETGVFQMPLVIPRFVIRELQILSDSSDRLKRARGRRGLDLVTKLQRSPRLDVTIDETQMPGMDVDQMLVELARQMNAGIITTDVGLRRIATIQSIPVLSMNELANALKPNVLPGEAIQLSLIKAGEQAGQAVGYLDDGTMVVAEDGQEKIGSDVTIIVTSTMQTSAGRLIFGKLADPAQLADASSDSHAGMEALGNGDDPDGSTPSGGRRRPGPPRRNRGA
jgi:uncharacterized protein YacL